VSVSTHAVTHAQNPYVVPGNPIADDVRVNERPLTQIGAGYWTTPLGKVFQAVARRRQLMREVFGSPWVKPGNVIVDVANIA
jgi:hypothetical protein